MRIRFERTGGVAGMRLAAAIDTQALPPGEGERLVAMVEAAGLLVSSPRIRAASRARPDAFTYSVTIEVDEERREYEIAEAAADEPLRPLLEWLTRAARERRNT